MKVVVVFGCSGSADPRARDADAAPGLNDAPAFPRCLVWFHDCADTNQLLGKSPDGGVLRRLQKAAVEQRPRSRAT